MKIETISVMQRKNLGNYEHIELSASAKVEEGEEALTAMMTLRTFVETAINGKIEEMKNDKIGEPTGSNTKSEESNSSTPEVSKQNTETEVKAPKRTRTKKEEVKETLDGQEIPPVIPEQKKEKVVEIPYNRAIEAHKNILSSYLSTNFPNWKTSKPREEIIAFTTSLEGKLFLDNSGEVLESFKNILKDFFGA